MKKYIAFVTAVALLFPICACANANTKKYEKYVFAMDTVMQLYAYGSHAEVALDDAEKMIEAFDALFSAEKEGSDIQNLNSNGMAVVDEATAELIEDALTVSERSGGALDLSVYPASIAWGFAGDGENRVPTEDELAKIHPKVDYSAICVNGNEVSLGDGMLISLGAVAKGYTAQRVIEKMRDDGVISALISLGGNVQALGADANGDPWRVGIQDPNDLESNAAVLEIADLAVVTSGDYNRYFEVDGVRYHHILDPKTCTPAQTGIRSVTVITDDGTTADALSTALFVLGVDGANAYWRQYGGFEMVILTDDGRILATDGAPIVEISDEYQFCRIDEN